MASMSSTRSGSRTSAWGGLLIFAAIMMLMVGVFNIIEGIAAIAKNEVFVNTQKFIVIFDLTTWGWVTLILGVLQVVSGAALVAGQSWARWSAIVLVWINAIGQIMFLVAYPFWSVLVITLDIVIIWALVAHHDELAKA